jgi:hypothetical protein
VPCARNPAHISAAQAAPRCVLLGRDTTRYPSLVGLALHPPGRRIYALDSWRRALAEQHGSQACGEQCLDKLHASSGHDVATGRGLQCLHFLDERADGGVLPAGVANRTREPPRGHVNDPSTVMFSSATSLRMDPLGD